MCNITNVSKYGINKLNNEFNHNNQHTTFNIRVSSDIFVFNKPAGYCRNVLDIDNVIKS